jgi:hypothetical protein
MRVGVRVIGIADIQATLATRRLRIDFSQRDFDAERLPSCFYNPLEYDLKRVMTAKDV